MRVEFEPNPAKDAINLQNHGISFATAQEIFNDPNQIVMENYFFAEDGEQRYQIIGITNNLVLLLVVYVDHSDAETEIIRIISARKADSYEKKLYAAAASKT